jgi:hypothetical protein
MAELAATDGKADKVANGGGGGSDAAVEGKKRVDQAVAFHELFSFADKWDLMLMAAGSLGALAHGAAMPFFFLLFGDLINGFGKNQTDLRTMTDEVAKVRPFFILCSPVCCLSRIRFLSPRSPLLVATLICVDVMIYPPLLLQYALYFVYLGLVVCVSSYAGDLPLSIRHSPSPRVPYDSPHHILSSPAPTHHDSFQGPIREIGSSHGRWGISKTTPLSYTSPVAITPNGEKLTITPYIMFVSFSCRRIRQASSPASTMPAGCRRRGLLLQSTMAFAGFRTIVSCTPTEAAFSFVLQRLRAGCTPGSGR